MGCNLANEKCLNHRHIQTTKPVRVVDSMMSMPIMHKVSESIILNILCDITQSIERSRAIEQFN